MIASKVLDWVRLPADAEWQCGRMAFGSKTDRHVVADRNPDRCQSRAAWERKSKCGCGSCDMSLRYCTECLLEHVLAELEVEKRTVERAVDLVRTLDKEIPSRDAARSKIYGVESFPPDPPDDYWKSNHPGVGN